MKKCKDCLLEKDSKLFYGVQGECKECTKNRVRLNYSKNKEYYANYDKKREKTYKRKKQKLESQKRQRKLNPHKYLARLKVHRALKKGTLERKPCKVCRDTKVQAHHEDYTKPLEVEWYCQSHHSIVDKILRSK